MTDTPYSPATATALAIGATSDGWVDETGVPWDGAVVSYNQRSIEQRTATLLTDLRDNLAALRAVVAPPTRNIRIMCVGDSITVGSGSTGPGGQIDRYGNGIGQGYRPWITDLLARRRISAQLTTLAQGGQTVRTMAPPTLAALPTAQPDIVLIDLGTNDMGGDFTDWQSRYGQFVDQILASSPAVRVACARIPYYRGIATSTVDSVNAAVDAVVQSRQRTGRVAAADMSVITQHWTADGMHPLDAAYLTMAQTWLTAIGPWLP
ncbi:SGNH/GDSL hydrolase family protein [Kitasatospora sp. NPDC087314]|uniref:SGNH/GDSL hydrolase family protein n=1 Tax=Kitasatospora sp. NPDC087314 TaxID=3364068 RepID=UPI00381ADABB